MPLKGIILILLIAVVIAVIFKDEIYKYIKKNFWEEYYKNYDKITREWEIIGVGNTPNDAVEDLIKKQKEKGLFYGI